MSDEKPACPCGSRLVFIIDRSESGHDFWRCLSCKREMVTTRPYRPLTFPLIRPKPLWGRQERES